MDNLIERAEAWLRCRPRFNSEPEDTTLIRDLLAVVKDAPIHPGCHCQYCDRLRVARTAAEQARKAGE